VRARPGGFALRSKRGPARKTADSAERRCRCPTVVAQPGAAKLQQLHHVPVMLRCSGAGPPARSHQSAVCGVSVHGEISLFFGLSPGEDAFLRRRRPRLLVTSRGRAASRAGGTTREAVTSEQGREVSEQVSAIGGGPGVGCRQQVGQQVAADGSSREVGHPEYVFRLYSGRVRSKGTSRGLPFWRAHLPRRPAYECSPLRRSTRPDPGDEHR
jgi:hypothetical protein